MFLEDVFLLGEGEVGSLDDVEVGVSGWGEGGFEGLGGQPGFEGEPGTWMGRERWGGGERGKEVRMGGGRREGRWETRVESEGAGEKKEEGLGREDGFRSR